MCRNCINDKGNGCECVDEDMTEEDIKKIESYEYNEDNCPFYCPYWAKKRYENE